MIASRLWFVLLATAGMVTACDRSADDAPAPAAEPTAPSELLPVAEAPLNRQGLLLAVAEAASDFAAARDGSERQLRLDGRRFEVRLRFGCPADDLATRQWSYDEHERVLRVRVEPELSATEPILEALGLDTFEAVEGFWIRRPWMLQAACPARDAESEPPEEEGEQAGAAATGSAADRREPSKVTAPEPRIAIAHFFTEQDSRIRRRDNRAYEATVKLAAGESPSLAGYDLVLSGRLASLPDGRVIACAGDGALAAPRCIVSVDFDRVQLARPDGTMLADWSSG